MSTFTKDPDATKNFVIDWTDILEATDEDTISSSSWTVPSGITNDGDSNTLTTTQINLSGGTLYTEYALVNQIVTAGSQTWDKTVTVYVTNE